MVERETRPFGKEAAGQTGARGQAAAELKETSPEERPRIAICWLGGCGGCDEAVVDINEAILKLAAAVSIVFWPLALDYKYEQLEGWEDGELALAIINGNVRNSEHEQVARLLRRKSRMVLAFGACACFGGTPGLANFCSRKEILDCVYRDAPTVVNPGVYPQAKTRVNGKELTLPEFHENVQSLDQVIDVDYYLPGCPPPPDLVMNAIRAVMVGKLPPKGSTLAPHKALCDSCHRNRSKPERLVMSKIRRVHEIEADNDTCFLAQGILCAGPATRDGCGQSCININLPCRGCFGPVEGVKDSGAKFVSALSSMLDAEYDPEIQKVMESIIDLGGYLYRFTLPVSTLKKKV